jgi:tetratricopeptide (TPR) repeat protein
MKFLRFLTLPITWGLIALAVLLLELTPWVYPGESATMIAHFTKAWHVSPALLTAHPLVTVLGGAFAHIFPNDIAIISYNVLTAIVGSFCVFMLCLLVRHVVSYLVDESNTSPFIPRAIAFAVPSAGVAMLISPDFLRAATHFQWQTFDLAFILGTFGILLTVAQKPTPTKLAIASFTWGIITCEAPECLVLTPIFLIALAAVYYFEEDPVKFTPFITTISLSFLLGLIISITSVMMLHQHLAPNTSWKSVAITQIMTRYSELRTYINGPWILLLLTGFMPSFLTLFLLKDVGKNRRTPTLVFSTIAAITLGLISLLPINLSISRLTSTWSDCYPLLFVALTAFAFAGLIAVAIFFISVEEENEATEELHFIRPLAKFVGWCVLLIIPIGLLMVLILTTRPQRVEEKQFAQLPITYVNAVLKSGNNQETWLLSDGVADIYLALRISQCKHPITLFSLSQNGDSHTQRSLIQRLQDSPYFKQKPELIEKLTRSIEIGLVPFIQDWLRNDPTAEAVFATMNLPDLWYTGNRLPLPQGLWYRGANDRPSQHAKLVVPEFDNISLVPATPSKNAFNTIKSFAEYIKRQQSFVLNNTAFYLADAGKMEEAYKLFRKVYDFHPDNVSALFNIFELINGGLHPEDRAWCENEINEVIRRMRGRRYQLWALARTYGYIRSPQLMSMLAGSWAMSGQTGAALSGMDLTLAMLGDNSKAAMANQMLAEFYKIDPAHRRDAISKFQQMLQTSTDHHQSLVYVREIVRMQILDNNLEGAKQTLEQADPMSESIPLAYERALWFAAANQPDRARVEVELFIANMPRHPEALALLATLQMQAGEYTALTAETLPKLKRAAGTEDNYFVQIITAQLAEKESQLKKARTSYLRALALKPEVHALRNTILRLDIQLNDKAAAAQHAKEFLYQDRDLPLANYIVGALALGEGDAKRARSYLSQATAPTVNPPLPEAFNDLAEAHRQLGDWTAALSTAEHACKLSPNLAIARETAAAALLELGRYADAHAYLKEAFELEAKLRSGKEPDPRLLITRARLYAKEGNIELARIDLAAARPQYDSLDRKAKAEFDALSTEIQSR